MPPKFIRNNRRQRIATMWAVVSSAILLSSMATTSARTIQWSGHEWLVRDSGPERGGPGPNFWSDSQESVWVDELGRLHLRVRYDKGVWYCAEVWNTKSLGYGRYLFLLSTPPDAIDPRSVIGMFVYANDANEIDIELSRWGERRKYPLHQFVVQPAHRKGNKERRDYRSRSTKSAHGFRWRPEGILFESFAGHRVKGKPFNRWLYQGPDNFKPSTEKIHINHWLYQSKPPLNGKASQIIVDKFIFVPEE